MTVTSTMESSAFYPGWKIVLAGFFDVMGARLAQQGYVNTSSAAPVETPV